MDEAIEIGLESLDGIIDCRLEPLRNDDDVLYYSVTILYPNVVNGYSRSEIFCYNMAPQGNTYYFEVTDDGIHPKIQQLEAPLSDILVKANGL